MVLLVLLLVLFGAVAVAGDAVTWRQQKLQSEGFKRTVAKLVAEGKNIIKQVIR